MSMLGFPNIFNFAYFQQLSRQVFSLIGENEVSFSQSSTLF